MGTLFAYMADLEQKGIAFALASIIKATDNSPGRERFKLCITSSGESKGTIGGGALEYTIQQTALEMLRTREHMQIHDLTLQSKENSGIGMECGGTVTVLIECYYPQPWLYIFGGGHIASHLVQFASALSFNVAVLDDRKEYASPQQHPMAVQHHHINYDASIQNLKFNDNAYFVIVTHQHSGDEAVLRALLTLKPEINPLYIGLIGSRNKLAKMFSKMAPIPFSQSDLEFVHAPIGVDHGGQTAPEIALSIATEITAARHGVKMTDSMKYKRSPLP